ILVNGDRCNRGKYVLATLNGQVYVGRVIEILEADPSSGDGDPDGFLLQRCVCSIDPSSYSMPYVASVDEWHSFQHVLCAVNVQHACSEMNPVCTPSGQAAVTQERKTTAHTRAIIQHTKPEDRLILNTAQMRDAVNLQGFRIPTSAIDEDDTL
ncbi:hypothetical protein FA13DRAFT_1607880, partial [Coprinellus micaceus]